MKKGAIMAFAETAMRTASWTATLSRGDDVLPTDSRRNLAMLPKKTQI